MPDSTSPKLERGKEEVWDFQVKFLWKCPPQGQMSVTVLHWGVLTVYHK